MNGIDYLADTNAILYFLSGNECMIPFVSSHFAFSVINEMELLSYHGITEEEEHHIREFLSECISIGLTESIKERAIRLRRTYNIKLPDAIIAASAIENDIILITADTGFEKVRELKLKLIEPIIND